ncbi:hypothetical protein GO013_14225 [Pseudodesulfovibrio sp. JC047]|uniref:hypothetical protein n=1 Tax=Pseudodesulfovibrio sp. JC047 TaxID=2683199 RepID=UPI0013D8C67E|nr:hypothetical protein [Pseudodesulfovibrio sp. JC047]NDV20565.1 hypothetical protein [Pseudodesulfovibrio sp. JC047]
MNKDTLAKACIEALSNSSLPPKTLITSNPRRVVDEDVEIAWDRCAPGQEGGRTTIAVVPISTETLWREPVEVMGFGNLDTCYGKQNVRLNHFLFQRRMEREYFKPMREMQQRIIEAYMFGKKTTYL